MGEPAFSINFTARMLAASACNIGNVLVYDSAVGYWKVATAANRTAASARSQAIALTAYGGSAVGKVAYQAAGTLAAEVSGLAAGSASWVRCSSTGTIERCTPAPGDDIIGYAEADGRVHLCFGILTSAITAGGGGASPGGTVALETFGAVGDGVTNDTAAFESAAAAIAAGTYKTLVLAAKTYLVNPTTVWPMGGNIVGQGPSSVLKTTQARAIILMYDPDLADRIKSTMFANFRMVGSASGSLGSGAPANQNGIEVSYLGSDGAARVSIQNVEGYRLDRAFSVAASDEISIGPRGASCWAEECKYGYYLGAPTDWVNCQAVRCNRGVQAAGGNVQFNGSLQVCNIGIELSAGGNDGHGVFTGRIVHCTTPISSPGALVNGFLFDGIELFEGEITIANGNTGAIIFHGGQIDATTYTLLGKSRWLGVTFDTGYFSSVSTTGGDNEFVDCRDIDGTIPSWIRALIHQRYTPPSDANQTLTAQQSRASVLEVLTGVFTAARNITSTRSPHVGESVMVVNRNAQSVNYFWATGNGIVIPTNNTAIVGADGTNANARILASNVATAAGVFDPTTLALSTFVRGSFAGAPWVGVASAGASGSRNYIVGVAPAVGASLNGFASADFNGTTHNLAISGGLAMSSLISTTAYRISFLLEADTLSAPAGNIYDNRGIFTESGGNFGVVVNSAGVHCYHNDGGYKVASNSGVSATGTKYAVDIVYDGVNITVYVNGTAGTPVAAGTLGSLAGTPHMGANFNVSVFFDGRIWDFYTAQTALGTGGITPAQHKGYINDRYSLSL